MTDCVVETRDLKKVYQMGEVEVHALRGVSFCINRGEVVSIMGPSGSGKSTLLFILGLLLSPDAGTYRLDGEDVAHLKRSEQSEFRRRLLGFVFQSCNLIEYSTVYENLEFPLIYSAVRQKERRPKIVEALRRVNLEQRLHHPANLLSGGEQQRVALARAFVNDPVLILADEPTGQLDRHNGQLVLDYFQAYVAEEEKAIVVVTHDPEVAERCSRVFRLEDGVLVDTRHSRAVY